MRPDALVVVPTYNEAANLPDLAGAVRRHASLLVVDDASPDGTGRIADDIAAEDQGTAVLHRSSKAGLGPAYAAGFAAAIDGPWSIVLQMDADFSHDPADIPRLIAAIDEGAEVAIGSRYVPGGSVQNWPWHRRLLSRAGNRYARLMTGSSTRDMTAGFRAFRAEALARLDPASCRASGYGFQIEMAWRSDLLGLDVTEVPISFTERIAGASKMSPGIALEAMTLATRWGWDRARGRVTWPA
ncbi:MAG: polyprenol monophosphomannose synthase [Acidimicrobiia bacterium]|nr:polyprenol monophosphomannose synthase [Acidimicrobiia bacterium]